ncbi:hypothetical protein Zmor_024452 [Zophobas morio]|uniref:Fibrinogen C-terminal domain-containing protein n=1 Tax=Zophobas morio TaxID=2755281 RepID=A0AA38I379_9CUCU|nr:hypothetical protein Zmor_024452 [Zophobas morio]
MVSKVVLLLMLLFRNVFLSPSETDDFAVVFTSKSQPKFQPTVNDPFFVRLELLLEINTTLEALKESVNNLQNIKREIIEEVENVVEEKISIYDADLKEKLSQTKTEIVAETKENVRLQVTEAKNEIQEMKTALQNKFKICDTELKNELDKTKKEILAATEQQLSLAKNEIFNRIAASETKLAISKNENFISNSTVITQFKEMEANMFGELNAIKNHLVSIDETEKSVKEQLVQTKNEMIDQMKALRECAESVLPQNEKQPEGPQSNLQIHFEKTQLKKTQEETEVQQFRTVPGDCREIQKEGYNTSGTYRIQPKISLENFLVWCDMSTKGGGWTYVLNRFDGSQNFYLSWADYKQGFGNLSGEHWLGLDHVYELTNSKPTELLFELMDWDSKTVYALYSRFQIGSEAENYQIKTLGLYNGNAGDSFRGHNGVTFSTVDNDNSPSGVCAATYGKL